MTGKRSAFPLLLLCLALCISSVSAQDMVPQKDGGKVIRIVQEGVPPEFDADLWLAGGEFQLSDGLGFNPPRVIPGPAPEPYPVVHVWEKRIEQLGASDTECDGIYFQNGKIWVPNKKIFVVWRIRIPNPALRDPSEFEEDLNVALWVDWNLSGDWEKNEEVIRESFNIAEYFPNDYPQLDIEFLTWFRVPDASTFTAQCGGIEFFKEKLWTRGVLSYFDPDASPNGESVFGEVEDYQVCYFEVVHAKDKKIK